MKYWERNLAGKVELLFFLIALGGLFAPVGLAFYLFYVLKKSGAITTNDWSIGQVVAVFTLVPVPVKAVYRIYRELHHSISPD
jgi:hypothetical protein